MNPCGPTEAAQDGRVPEGRHDCRAVKRPAICGLTGRQARKRVRRSPAGTVSIATRLTQLLMMSRTVIPAGIIGSTCSWYGIMTSSTYGPG